ncbi:hypothetical protein [Streptomyces physcomitrii]|uniref:Uncharacterized protein n=1 Tax=Streptomyces physcomitrii TaxID=2724184 RepID=A0ABX1H445_9ACTN|nr:hypothetical protein [Streptomyces physcomitrii]NKI43134.1 hypothetical protein [Streptomyces physcomitrii]
MGRSAARKAAGTGQRAGRQGSARLGALARFPRTGIGALGVLPAGALLATGVQAPVPAAPPQPARSSAQKPLGLTEAAAHQAESVCSLLDGLRLATGGAPYGQGLGVSLGRTARRGAEDPGADGGAAPQAPDAGKKEPGAKSGREKRYGAGEHPSARNEVGVHLGLSLRHEGNHPAVLPEPRTPSPTARPAPPPTAAEPGPPPPQPAYEPAPPPRKKGLLGKVTGLLGLNSRDGGQEQGGAPGGPPPGGYPQAQPGPPEGEGASPTEGRGGSSQPESQPGPDRSRGVRGSEGEGDRKPGGGGGGHRPEGGDGSQGKRGRGGDHPGHGDGKGHKGDEDGGHHGAEDKAEDGRDRDGRDRDREGKDREDRDSGKGKRKDGDKGKDKGKDGDKAEGRDEDGESEDGQDARRPSQLSVPLPSLASGGGGNLLSPSSPLSSLLPLNLTIGPGGQKSPWCLPDLSLGLGGGGLGGAALPQRTAVWPAAVRTPLLVLTGLTYHGIREVDTAAGPRRVLAFTAFRLDINDLQQDQSLVGAKCPGEEGFREPRRPDYRGLPGLRLPLLDIGLPGIGRVPRDSPNPYPDCLGTLRTEDGEGSTTTATGEPVVLLTQLLSGNLLGLLPITFTPDMPPPLPPGLTLPIPIFFTDVIAHNQLLRTDSLTIPGLHQSVFGPGEGPGHEEPAKR